MNKTLIAIVAAAFASAAPAQTKPIAEWASLSHLESGAEIRVAMTGGRNVIGFLQSVTADSIAINAATSQEALSRGDIKIVSLRRQGHRGRNALIGLSIGAGGGLATGAAVDHGSRPGGWFPNFGKEVFTPLGALVGAVVGVAIPTGGWRVVYRAQ
jgi:hypothetical protein